MKKTFHERQTVIIPGSQQETIDFCVHHFIETANKAIEARGLFAVALSGGSTPNAIFNKLSEKENRNLVDYSKVFIFWSDERDVPLDDSESNYKMAMDAGINQLSIPKNNIFPMRALEKNNAEENAHYYNALLNEKLPDKKFDLVMLGMGDDGHTASLFPNTKALHIVDQLAVANEVPQKKCYRITLTYTCINEAREIAVYVLGKSKAEMVYNIFNSPNDLENLPVQGVGTKGNVALFILDAAAASLII